MSQATIQLEAEFALGYRILRTTQVPRDTWLALEGRLATLANSPKSIAAIVQKSLAEIIEPLLKDAKPAERSACQQADSALAQVFEYLWRSSKDWEFRQQLLASNLIPLYRSLATGQLYEGIQLTRMAMAQSVAIACMTNELGHDLLSILHRGVLHGKNPQQTLREALKIQLNRLASLLRYTGSRWDEQDGAGLVALIEQAKDVSETLPPWAQPELTWRLAGELISKKAEFVLPREWINTPVPWNSISDHWLALTSAIAGCEAESNRQTNRRNRSANPHSTWSENNPSDSPRGTNPLRDTSSQGSSRSPRALLGSDRTDAELAHRTNVDQEAVDALWDDSTEDTTVALEPVVAKVLMGEIFSHNDPAFTSLVGRQLAASRAEDRSVCLLAIRVEPESEQDRGRLQGERHDGLTLWQQRLVNWLADHPEIRDPYAFVCANGELIVCLMDIERNTATSLLRQGLIEVLTGNQVPEDSVSSLARVQVPARYHAGIASVSSPGASFSGEQLIGAAYRCLEAATRHGRAAIKSIEVF